MARFHPESGKITCADVARAARVDRRTATPWLRHHYGLESYATFDPARLPEMVDFVLDMARQEKEKPRKKSGRSARVARKVKPKPVQEKTFNSVAFREATGVGDRTARRFLRYFTLKVQGHHEENCDYRLTVQEFDQAIAEFNELLAKYPTRPLRGLPESVKKPPKPQEPEPISPRVLALPPLVRSGYMTPALDLHPALLRVPARSTASEQLE